MYFINLLILKQSRLKVYIYKGFYARLLQKSKPTFPNLSTITYNIFSFYFYSKLM